MIKAPLCISGKVKTFRCILDFLIPFFLTLCDHVFLFISRLLLCVFVFVCRVLGHHLSRALSLAKTLRAYDGVVVAELSRRAEMKARQEEDMETNCAVCQDGEVGVMQQIVFCEYCNVAVHQQVLCVCVCCVCLHKCGVLEKKKNEKRGWSHEIVFK